MQSTRGVKEIFWLTLVSFLMMAFPPNQLFGQATIQGGSIQGAVTDTSGAVVPGAQVTITNKATGQVRTLNTNDTGNYNSGPLAPGDYTVRVEKEGFRTTETATNVLVGTITSGNTTLQAGSAGQVVTVEATTAQVNTEQATVQGVLTTQQIDNLPINGRNFLDLAQLEPGVQISDGTNFDPTKNGYTGISIGGRQGRTTRIEVDGIDISDETVGTTTQNISASSIQEFQISQSSLDLSTELTSSGAVNVVTRSGTNTLHGQGFYLFRDKRAGYANFPGDQDLPFQRNHYGGNLGGPIFKDRVFFFVNGEHIKQDQFAPVVVPDPFSFLSGGYNSPYRETQALGKLDWQVGGGAKLFYRFTYNNNTVTGSTLPNYQAFANRDNAPVHAVGLDFTTGSFTHSIRAGYTKFVNRISDASSIVGAFNLLPNINLRIGRGNGVFRSGPNLLAPQATFQTNKQIKYDGSKLAGRHIFRFGVGYNRILGGGFANFLGIAPVLRTNFNDAGHTFANTNNTFGGGDTNPLNYPVNTIFVGNGQGFFTERSEFDLPAGGQFDSRVQAYVGDTFKIRPNFTLNLGLRYVRDTGRTDSDLSPLTCADINVANFDPAPPCSGLLLDNFGNIPGLGGKVRQPNINFGPQIGLAWDPFSTGKTVLRAGVGLFYENGIFNNVLFDRPVRLGQGLFNTLQLAVCPGGQVIFPGNQIVTTTPGGLDIATQVCGQPIGSVANEVAALQQAYQAAVSAAGVSTNPNFVGETLSPILGGTLYAPNYQTPRSFQMNAGIQRELFPGGVISADYIRNVSLHYLLTIDTNYVGDARFLNLAAALNAMNGLQADLGCPPGAAGVDCAIANGATIQDYADFGLDSGATFLGGSPAGAFGLAPEFGAAFPGINPFFGQNAMLFPVGRSVYNALQVAYRQNLKNPLRGFRNVSMQIGYALSRFTSITSDQDFVNNPEDQRKPTNFNGPNSFDRTSQFSIGTLIDFPGAVRFSFISHLYSALPQDIRLPNQFRSGEIFNTDLNGDGAFGQGVGEILPGTNLGSFGRDVTAENLNNVFTNFNNSSAGTLTPAGQALVNAGLFTPAQLAQLGAVVDSITLAPAGQVGNDWLKTFDARLSVPFRVTERFTIEPSIQVFNVFNFANFEASPATLLSGIADGSPGSINGTTGALDQRTNRAGLGTGVFSQGAARQMEFGLRISF